MKKFLLFLILPAAVFGSYPSVDENSKTKIIAARVNDKIVIDGNLTEEVWQRPGFNKLIQQDPEQGIRPSQNSEFWVAYDNEVTGFTPVPHVVA